MTLLQANFNTDTAAGTLTGFVLPGGTGIRQLSGVAQTTATTPTILAYGVRAPSGLDQFAQMTLVNNLGSSSSVIVNGFHNGTENGYILRHNGADLAIMRFVGGVNSTLANVAHTRAAGQELRLTRSGSTLTGYINGVAVVTATDPTPLTDIGSVGLRASGTSGVQYDDFAGGDLADLGNVVAGADNTLEAVFTEIVPTPNLSGIPPWRGLRYNRAGEMILPGELLHRQRLDFWGLSGAYAAPTGWATTGTAALISPVSGVGVLELATDGTDAAKAGLSCSVPIAATQHGAILIEAGGVHFSAANPAADFRLGATNGTAGGGLVHLNGATRAFLASSAETYRTRTESTILGVSAHRRRPISVLVVPSTREVWLLERNKVIGYHDALTAWSDANLTVAVEITARAAAVQRLRLTSLTVSTFA